MRILGFHDQHISVYSDPSRWCLGVIHAGNWGVGCFNYDQNVDLKVQIGHHAADPHPGSRGILTYTRYRQLSVPQSAGAVVG